MAKIAAELERALLERNLTGAAGRAVGRTLADGDGWSVDDVICTSGPDDRPFEESYSGVSIAVVAAGTFEYGTVTGRELMTPGSLLLGNPGQCFECGHQHGAGDRCIAFRFSPDYFERISADLGTRASKQPFRVPRLGPLRTLSPLVARVCAGIGGAVESDWEELGIRVAAQVIQLMDGLAARRHDPEPSAVARVTRVIRTIEQKAESQLTLSRLANEAGLSSYHFLRIFKEIVGVTPHQYVLRTRLRAAALRLAAEPHRVLDIALGSGFGDISNFNRTFRVEFGVKPLVYRRVQHKHNAELLPKSRPSSVGRPAWTDT